MKTILKKASAAVMALAVMGAAVAFDVPGKMTAKAASAVGGCYWEHSEMTPWTNDQHMTDGGYYYIDRSVVEINAPIDITGEVTLCLNGKTITAVSDTRIFNVKNGGTLTICDCNGRGEIIGGAVSNNGGDNNGGAVYVGKNGTFILSGGKITGGSAEKGGGVYVHSDGKFKMDGGEISGNNANEGGGVYLYNNTAIFEMSGGKILDNTAGKEGGGVYVNSKSVFEMTGGEISDNTVEYISDNRNGGGGVYTAGTFTMSGKSSISGNTVGNIATGEYHFGGGVCVSGSNAEFTMNGGTLSGNKAGYGGGVYVSTGTFNMIGGKIGDANEAVDGGGGVGMGGGEFRMSGGTISGNTTPSSGGGVYVHKGEFVMSKGTISDNASNNGGGVYLRSGEFTMSGGAISKNTAKNFGCGVYVDNKYVDDKYKDGGKITLNGTVDITSPKKADGSESNVYLRIGKTITIGTDFDAVSKIGIHPEQGIKCDNPVDVTEFDTGVKKDIKEVSEQFKPDIAGQKIAYDNDRVQLTVDHAYSQTWSTDDTYHWHICSNCGYINPNDKAAHDWNPVIIDATCLEDGSKTDTCSVCDLKKESETLAATGHNWGDWTTTKEPTSTEPGKKERVCKNDASHIESEEIPMRIEPLPDSSTEPDPAPDSDPVSEPAAPVTSDPGDDSSAPDDNSSVPNNSSVPDDNSSNSNSSTESGNTDNNGGHENASPNPSTGIAISIVPLAAAITALTVVIRRKKK